jgi:nitroreductase
MRNLIVGVYIMASVMVSAQMNTVNTISAATKMNDDTTREKNNIWYVIQNRRSVRKFKPDSIPEKDIIKIIDAARMAPTSGNQQPWKFLVIRDSSKIKQMKDSCISKSLARCNNKDPEKLKQFKLRTIQHYTDYCSAPVFIIVSTDNNSQYPNYNHWDGPLAAGYLMLAARALGYGTVFITDAIPDIVTKEVFNIPDNYTRVCITPLGIPDSWPEMPKKKSLESFIAFDKL